MKKDILFSVFVIAAAVFIGFGIGRERAAKKEHKIQNEIFQRKTDSLLNVIDSLSELYISQKLIIEKAAGDIAVSELRYDSLRLQTEKSKKRFYERDKFGDISVRHIDSVFNDALSGASVNGN